MVPYQMLVEAFYWCEIRKFKTCYKFIMLHIKKTYADNENIDIIVNLTPVVTKYQHLNAFLFQLTLYMKTTKYN